MEDILASIRKVIDEDKELQGKIPHDQRPGRGGDVPNDGEVAGEGQRSGNGEEDVLELDQPLAEAPAVADPGPPLLSATVTDASRQSLAALTEVAASAPPLQPQANPLEAMVREMLRPILKEWLDDHLPEIVDQHVKREIARITGRPL